MKLTAVEKAKLTAKWATTITKWHIGFVTKWKALGIGEGQADKALAEPQRAIELNSNWSALIRSIGFVFGSRNAL